MQASASAWMEAIMDTETETTSNLVTAFEAIEDDVLEVHAKWKIFKQLFGKSEQRIALLNDFAPDFFRSSMTAFCTTSS